jgi:thiol-disulfide isomerase/thioredoxin
MRVSTSAAVAIVLLSLISGAAFAKDAVTAFDSDRWQEVTSAHKGEPVIVHFWGFTCGNCMVELKDWGTFANAHPGARIVFVNWDRRTATPERITAALSKVGLGDVQSLALGNGFENKLRFAVDRTWMGELPYTRLIAADGTATSFSGSADFTKLADWLAKEKSQ